MHSVIVNIIATIPDCVKQVAKKKILALHLDSTNKEKKLSKHLRPLSPLLEAAIKTIYHAVRSMTGGIKILDTDNFFHPSLFIANYK